MFRRRSPLRPGARLKALIWPAPGWRRALSYLGHRVGRLSGSPHRVAAGLACGVAASITPLIGLHIALAALMAFLIRGNVLAAIAGTLVGNPWTLPVIWLGSYRLGLWLLPDAAVHPAIPPFVSMFATLTRAVLTLDADLFLDGVWPVWWPMLVGSLPLAAAAGLATYLVGRGMIGEYQERSRKRRGRPRPGDPVRPPDACR